MGQVDNLESSLGNVLFLEDVNDDRLAVRSQLEIMGFVVYDTPSPIEAKEIFGLRDYNLIVVHLNHAPLRGLEFCRWIRSASTIPLIFLTSREEVVDETMAVDAGADDYVVKPIDSIILSARVTQQVKRGLTQRAPRANILTWSTLRMDLGNHNFHCGETEVLLTNIEYQFMQLLMENPQRIFSRNQILEAVGILKGVGSDHIVDTHVSRIRVKIKRHGGPEVINVVRSVGFRLATPGSTNPVP
jgi:DNA-binding response OmpR family regulator